MKKVLIPLLAIALIAGAVGFYMYNKPVENLNNKKAEVTVTAEALLADYESNEQSANEKYLGKVVEVSGKVAEITTGEGKNKIHLETANPISVIIAELDEGNTTEGLAIGEQGTVKGLCSGYLSDVILVRSTIVK